MAIFYENSWIKLPRDFVKWEWYKNADVFHLYLFLLLNANLEDERSEGLIIRRGEIYASLTYISVATGLSVRNVRTCLKKLNSTQEIEFKDLGKGRVIIIVDFNKFQPIGADDEPISWIRLYRKICDWGWYKNQNMTHLFVHFMLNASIAFQPSGIAVAQCKCTLRRLNLETGISIHCIRDCIDKLQKSGQITYDTVTAHTYSIVTICNYVDYQKSKNLSDTISCIGTAHPSNTINTTTSREYSAAENLSDTIVTRYRHDGDTIVTRYRHDGDTNNKEYKNIRKEKEKKEFIVDDARARAHESDFSNFEDVETVVEIEKENEQKKVKKESLLDVVKADMRWMNAIKQRFGFSCLDDVEKKLDDFELDLICRGKEEHKDEKDLKSHFFDWVAKQKAIYQKASPSSQQQYTGFSRKERWPGEKFVPKSFEGYEGKF